MNGARLSGANLREANLSRTNLNGAILIDADLSGVNLNGVTYDDKTVFPGGFDPPSSSVKEADPLRPSMGGSSAEEQSDQPIVDGKQQTVPFKYPALRVISGFYRGLAYAIGGLALLLVLVGFVSLITYNYDGRWAIGLGVMFFAAVGGALGVISMLAISEVIILQVDIAHDVNAIKREVQDGE